eukprot:312063-Rhodomonas_salina.1
MQHHRSHMQQLNIQIFVVSCCSTATQAPSHNSVLQLSEVAHTEGEYVRRRNPAIGHILPVPEPAPLVHNDGLQSSQQSVALTPLTQHQEFCIPTDVEEQMMDTYELTLVQAELQRLGARHQPAWRVKEPGH